MYREKLHALAHKFFRGKDGKWIITQPPNLIITIWVVLVVASFLFKDTSAATGLSLLRDSSLFAWAYLEIRYGDSNFRRALGSVVMVGLVLSFFA